MKYLIKKVGMGWAKNQPEAILANPTQAIFLWTRVTRRNCFTNWSKLKKYFSINTLGPLLVHPLIVPISL